LYIDEISLRIYTQILVDWRSFVSLFFSQIYKLISKKSDAIFCNSLFFKDIFFCLIIVTGNPIRSCFAQNSPDRSENRQRLQRITGLAPKTNKAMISHGFVLIIELYELHVFQFGY